jgi:hypothetical protein
VNCPFDSEYVPLFQAAIFTITECGFRPRCALEEIESGQVRIEKILDIISECRLGIHDISRTEIDRVTNLPRFNMPLELGMFIGALRFGNPQQRRKKYQVVDHDGYRFRQSMSDIAGQDIAAHAGDPVNFIKIIRDWLNGVVGRSGRTVVPGNVTIAGKFARFRNQLPALCSQVGLDPVGLSYRDLAEIISEWLEANK